MGRSSKLTALQAKTAELLAKALTEIQHGRVKAPQAKEGRFGVAEYLVTEAKEYVGASWDLLRAEKPRASLAVSRWLVEAALNLLWVTTKTNEIAKRLKLLVAEALRLEAAKLEGLGELQPSKAKQFKDQAAAARQKQRDLVAQPKWRLDPLSNRIDSIKAPLKAKSMPNPYVFYRICCAAAHPGLEVWRRFDQAPRGAAVMRKPSDDSAVACLILACSALWLVTGAYCLVELGDANGLKNWWEGEIVPLLHG